MSKFVKFKYLVLCATGTLVLLVAACSANPSDGSLRVGTPAPDFTLASGGGGEVSLADYKEKQPVLLYFSMADG
jgi:hypothetical protein